MRAGADRGVRRRPCRVYRVTAQPALPEPGDLEPETILRCFARARLPTPARRGRGEPAPGLAALSDRYDAFILDGYGVVNVGAEPVPGIVDAVEALRGAGRAVMVLTNGAGRPVRWSARRYAEWGVGIPERLVVSSRDSLEAELAAHPRPGLWGVMAKPDSELETLPAETALLGDDDALYREADGFILLRSGEWTVERHRRLVEALRSAPRPVLAANPDVSAPYPDGSFSAEPGYWALRVEAEAGVRCERFGKPFPSRLRPRARLASAPPGSGGTGSRWSATGSTPTSSADLRRVSGPSSSPTTAWSGT